VAAAVQVSSSTSARSLVLLLAFLAAIKFSKLLILINIINDCLFFGFVTRFKVNSGWSGYRVNSVGRVA
jgi:hypothetical protein